MSTHVNGTTRGRYLMITTATNVGGMERIVARLAHGLGAAAWRVRVALPVGDGSEALRQWFLEQGVDAVASELLTELGATHTIGGFAATARFVRGETPNVAHFHFGSTFISLKDTLAARIAGVPRLIATVHGAEPWSALGQRKRRLTGLSALFCDSVVAVSDAGAALLRQAGVRPARLRVIRDGVQPPIGAPSRTDARARLGIANDAFVVATLARLVPAKGIGDLIEAAALASAHDPCLVLLVGGDGPARDSLAQQAYARLGARARFLGELRDPHTLYAAADVFALPSYSEGLGLVLIEAALQSVPVVATRVGGIPEIVHDGATGLLVPPRSAAALAEALRRLRDDSGLRHRLGAAAREHALDDFNEDRMCAAYDSLGAGEV